MIHVAHPIARDVVVATYLRYLQSIEGFGAELVATKENAERFTDSVLWPAVEAREPVLFATDDAGAFVGATFSVLARGFEFRVPHLVGHGTFIEAEWRRHGIASLLLRHVREWMKTHNIRRQIGMVHVGNGASLKTFEKLGFTPHGIVLAADL